MSRYKDPPKEICMVRTIQGKWTNTDASPKTLEELGLTVALYDLRLETMDKSQQRPRRIRKPVAKKTPTDMPPEQDKAPTEATEVQNKVVITAPGTIKSQKEAAGILALAFAADKIRNKGAEPTFTLGSVNAKKRQKTRYKCIACKAITKEPAIRKEPALISVIRTDIKKEGRCYYNCPQCGGELKPMKALEPKPPKCSDGSKWHR